MKLRGENTPVKGRYRYMHNPKFEGWLEQACQQMRQRMAKRRCWCGRPEAHQGAHRGPRQRSAA
jgi:hypothetical protein